MASKKLKASEKSAIVSKMLPKLKKRYGSKVPTSDRDVLETFIFSACLEDAGDEEAEAAYTRLLDQFHDMNEIRVSLITEIERTLENLSEPAFRARRVREGLQHFFEEHFRFDLEPLKKKTQDSASQEIGAAPFVTPFMRLYTLNTALGAHVFPVDGRKLALLKWIGLVDPSADEDAAADEMKSAVRKADVPLTAFLLRQAAGEPNVLIQTMDLPELEEGEEPPPPAKQAAALEDLIDGKLKAPAKKPSKKKAAAKKKTTRKKAATKKAAKK